MKPWSLLPGLVPLRMPRMACWAPKLMRRLNGVVGAVRTSSSSTAFSSIESELVDRLARRMNEAEAVGDVPDKPRVVMERRRRCCSVMAAVERGPGKGATGFWELPRKRFVRAAEEIDPRRCERAMSLLLLLLLLEEEEEVVLEAPLPLVLSEDMVGNRGEEGVGENRFKEGSWVDVRSRTRGRARGAGREFRRQWRSQRAGPAVGRMARALARTFIVWNGPRWARRCESSGAGGGGVGRGAKPNDDCGATLQNEDRLFFVHAVCLTRDCRQ